MARFEDIAEQLRRLTSTDARDKMLAKGLARGFIWVNGELPAGAPLYGRHLTGNLLDYGYSILAKAIVLYENRVHIEVASESLRFAAECIESAVRRGLRDDYRGFHLVVSAAAFHLAGYAARSFCLLEEQRSALNLSTVEVFFVRLLRKELRTLRIDSFNWLNDVQHQDGGLSEMISISASEEGDVDTARYELLDILVLALSRNYVTALARFEYALSSGSALYFEDAKARINEGAAICSSADIGHVPLWWCHKLTSLLMDDVWRNSLHILLPSSSGDGDTNTWNVLRKKFIAVQVSRNLSEVSLWPSQLESATRVIDPVDDLVVALPTSAGKTKIAELCILRALSLGKRAVYVTPLRALSAQIERRLARTFRPLGYSVSSLYGASGVSFQDVSTLTEDSIVVATPEKLDFALRQDSSLLDDIGVVILDEGHMIGLGTREIRYEVLVQRLLRRSDADNRRIVCLSAIFSSGESFDDFTSWLRSDAKGGAVHSSWRPTRQRVAMLTWSENSNAGRLIFQEDKDFEEAFIPGFLSGLAPDPSTRREKNCPANPQELTLQTTARLVRDGHKVLIYCPQKRSVEPLGEMALRLHKQKLFPSLLNDSRSIKKALAIGDEWLGSNHIALQCLHLGIGIHHGSLPRPFLSEVESLLESKALPIVIASPTMAQGVDLTCSAIVFHSVYQFKDELIKASDYANVIGRVGRAFVDLDGLIVFPLFKPTRGRISDLKQLMSASGARIMESGLIQLISSLINLIKEKLGVTDDRFVEYVLNQNFDWKVPDTDEEQMDVAYFIDSLDNAIMATLDDLDADPQSLAQLLDAALQSSLWQRRLRHLSETKILEQKLVMTARTAWLWRHSNASQRKGFFSAGVGYTAGSLMAENLDGLIQNLQKADQALNTGLIDEFAEQIEMIAQILFGTHPYSRKDRDSRWNSVLKLWLSGASLNSLNGDSDLLACIQEDFVFRLVWMVEAIRAYAREIGRLEVETLSGAIPLAITYGVPSHSAAVLLQCGLRSRQVAQEILGLHPAVLRKKLDVAHWVQSIVENPFEIDSPRYLIWDEFASGFLKEDIFSPWEKIWRIPIANSEEVMLIPKNGQTIVSSTNMNLLGLYEFDSRNLAVYDVQREDTSNLLVYALRTV